MNTTGKEDNVLLLFAAAAKESLLLSPSAAAARSKDIRRLRHRRMIKRTTDGPYNRYLS